MKILAAILLSLVALAPSMQAHSTQPEWCRALPRPGYKTLHRVPVSDAWFEVYEVSPSTFAIYEPRQSEETIGYLIEGSQRALLFDTGMGIGDLKKLISNLTQLPIVVLNSHTHGDHVGGNWQFSTIYGMESDFTRKNAQGSSKQAQQEIKPSEICGALPVGFNAKTYTTRPWKITKYIHDSERIDLGGRSLEVIATPGHTPDAICLFDPANSLLFTGDTYYPGTIYLFAPETDPQAYGNSVHRLAALTPQVKIVLGAHNFPISDPSILIKLQAGFDAIQAGKVTSSAAGPGKVIYKAEGISFLMRAKE